MFRIKTLAVKNFMSVGNATQAVHFDRKDLTLVLGQNLDLGGDDTGARNGTGKTTIINALSYALYGNALTNIKKDNLINKTNGKNMLVTIEFEKDGIDYKIERGRKPNTMAFYIGNQEQEITDESQGDSRETQAEIERMLGMSHEMFKHIVALNTYTEPFLALRSNDQRTIIEQLLGITMLSEKAELLKIQIKELKDKVASELFRIEAIKNSNESVQISIRSIETKSRLWETKKSDELEKISISIAKLEELDSELEIQAHHDLATWKTNDKALSDLLRQQNTLHQSFVRATKILEKAAKSKEELLAEARELGLEVSDETTVKDLKAAIAEKQEADKPEESEPEAVADGAGEGREPSVVDEPAESFDERTQKTVPWQED